MQRTFFNSRSGFSLIEMLVATVLVMILSATSYRILSKQGTAQKANVISTKKNTQILSALDRFKKDVQLIDPQWLKFGVASVFPHQGLGFGENFYVNNLIRDEGLNDGVTILRRDIADSHLYTLNVAAEYPTPGSGAVNLYGGMLTLAEPSHNISNKDYVLIYQGGRFALGVVSSINATGIRVRMPNVNERETSFFNAFGRTTGHVMKSGVVVGSFDVFGTNTSSADDNSIRLEAGRAQIQVVKPVSYEIDYATTDGRRKSASNAYLLDELGNRKKVIVRTEYVPPGIKREYLAEANQLGITYDALKSTTDFGVDSLQGYTDGDLVKDIGRDAQLPLQFVNLSMDPANITFDDPAFVSTSRILSIRMHIGNNLKEGGASDQKINEIRVAIDPNRKNDQYQEEGRTLANSSGNLANPIGNLLGKTIGQPLYMKRGGTSHQATDLYIPGSGDIDVVVPVANLNDMTAGSFENGKLVLVKDSGELVGEAGSQSEIRFNAGPNSYFYPSTLTESTKDGVTRVFVGGFSVSVNDPNNPTTVTRQPTMATIEFPSTMTFREYVAQQASNGNNEVESFSGGCSLANCTLKTITSTDFKSTMPNRFKDTAAGIATDGDKVYVASMTRASATDSTLAIYETNASMSVFAERVVDNSGSISSSRVISAIAQSPITVEGSKYLPVCTTRSINAAGTSSPQEDGKIILYNLSDSSAAPVEIANHNYKCKTLTAMGGNLVVAGNHVTQVMNQEEISALVSGAQSTPKILYTDEIYNHIKETNTNVYADGYYTLPAAYVHPASAPQEYQNVLGSHTGFTAMQLDPLTYGVVMGSRANVQGLDKFGNPADIVQQDFTTMTVNFGGMAERVIASIDTDFGNLNASEVVTKFGRGESRIPGIILPGNLYSNPSSPRTAPALLPQLQTGMTENQWFEFFQTYNKAASHSGPVHYMPSPVEAAFACGNSNPPTCQAGG